MSRAWLDSARWSMLCRWHFEQEEHILEMRGMTIVLRHLSRTSRAWNTQVLIFTDSLYTMGALSKGRSGARQVLRMCRAAAAVLLACNIKLALRLILSETNFAEGASRGGSILHMGSTRRPR